MQAKFLKTKAQRLRVVFFYFSNHGKQIYRRRKAGKNIVRESTTTPPRGEYRDSTTKWEGNLWGGSRALWTECATWVQVGEGIPVPEAVLGGERPRWHEVGGIWTARGKSRS